MAHHSQAQRDWRPSSSLDVLKLRATLLARIRTYFAHNGVMEVETPALSLAATTDPAIHSLSTVWHGPGEGHGKTYYLHTSPEFPMKRLLAAGSGDIYQLCKVFRDNERGMLHSPEFTLLEWYRTGFDHFDLMNDVERLVTGILADIVPVAGVHHWTYRDLFMEFAGIDPFTAGVDDIRARLRQLQVDVPIGMQDVPADAWLDLLMTHVIEPRLGDGLVFVRDYPVSMAALARLRSDNPPVAARFEAYLDGIEIANGFHELADAEEQARRFDDENRRRHAAGLGQLPVDQHLLAALRSGLPDCAGVALGLDRLLLVASHARDLDAVVAFPFEAS